MNSTYDLPPSLGTFATPEAFDDARGRLTIVSPQEEVNFIETITFDEADLTRGNHYHRHYHEKAFVQFGSMEVTLRHVDDPAVSVTVLVEAGQSLAIPPNVVHTFVSQSQTSVICFGYGSQSPTTDRHFLN